MSTNDLSRRDFLLRVSAFGALAVGSGTVLAACGGGEEPAAEAGAETGAGGGDMAAAQCDDVTGLTEQEISMRETLQYVSNSPYEDKLCSNCQLYIEAEAGAQCGGCQIIAGPIAPEGYCTSWAPMTS